MAMFTTANPEVEISNRDKIIYLKQYIVLDRKIDRMIADIERLRRGVATVYTGQPQGGGSIYGKTEAIVAKIVDLEQDINREIDRLIDIRAEIEAVIAAVEDDRERLPNWQPPR